MGVAGLDKCDSVASSANLKPLSEKGGFKALFRNTNVVSQMIYLCLFVAVHIARDTFSSV